MGELMGWWAVPTLLDAKQGDCWGDRAIVRILPPCVGEASRNGDRGRAGHPAVNQAALNQRIEEIEFHSGVT
ncbi:MAG: hypothetical protein KME47_07480 [Nodosilinea sp. WJT8-NPBG4]|nr:hypothetical protein [Nodosilinea sp. WJT8-NPBG4]